MIRLWHFDFVKCADALAVSNAAAGNCADEAVFLQCFCQSHPLEKHKAANVEQRQCPTIVHLKKYIDVERPADMLGDVRFPRFSGEAHSGV